MKKISTLIVLIGTFQLYGMAQAPFWSQENSQTFSRMRNIFFADNNTGWSFGDSSDVNGFVKGIVKKTTNQGLNWTDQDLGANSLRMYSSHFTSISSGIAVGRHQPSGQGAVAITNDGGVTWSNDTVSFPERLHDVDFASSLTGWISGRNGYLARTDDGGTIWNVQNTNTPEHLFGLDFFDTNFGWAVGADPGSGGVIIRTKDGGLNWTLQNNTVPNDLNSVYAISPAKVFAVGFSGTIVSTLDSGNTWIQVISNTPEDLYDIKFTDANNGWIAGTAGTILITTDGGLTWNPETSNTTNTIYSIDMKSTSLGWYCGSNGDIFFYGPGLVSVNEINEPKLKIFPNPSEGIFTINTGNMNSKSYKIYNLLGELISSGLINSNNIAIDISNFQSGTYFIQVEKKSGKIITEKISLVNQ